MSHWKLPQGRYLFFLWQYPRQVNDTSCNIHWQFNCIFTWIISPRNSGDEKEMSHCHIIFILTWSITILSFYTSKGNSRKIYVYITFLKISRFFHWGVQYKCFLQIYVNQSGIWLSNINITSASRRMHLLVCMPRNRRLSIIIKLTGNISKS